LVGGKSFQPGLGEKLKKSGGLAQGGGGKLDRVNGGRGKIEYVTSPKKWSGLKGLLQGKKTGICRFEKTKKNRFQKKKTCKRLDTKGR